MNKSSVFATLFFLLISINLFGQSDKSKILKFEYVFYDGKITLLDGQKLSGQVSFNDNEGIVAYRQGDDDVKYFNSKNIAGFEFKDPTLVLHRFFVMEYNDPKVGIPKFSFFEVLKEFKSFAVLAKIDPINTDIQRPLGIPTNKAMSSKSRNNVVATQVETIYFMSEDGDIQPYLEIIEKETEKRLYDYNRTRNRFVNEELFEEYTGPFYKELVEYAKSNELTFRRKSDLITLLNRYEYLLTH